MCRKILDSGLLGIHMYTLNLERSAVAILENLGLIDKQKVRIPSSSSADSILNPYPFVFPFLSFFLSFLFFLCIFSFLFFKGGGASWRMVTS